MTLTGIKVDLSKRKQNESEHPTSSEIKTQGTLVLKF